jgi:hypothetical protein
MSALCLTCDDKMSAHVKCVYTTQGDLQCNSPQDDVSSVPSSFSPASANQEYPINGLDTDGYYGVISSLSGQPIKMRYGETIPADKTNACAAVHVTNKSPGDQNNVTGIPEWGPRRGYTSPSVGLKNPFMEPTPNMN